MTIFRIYYEQLGGHVHMRVFAGKKNTGSLGKCGDLCMREDEFEDFQKVVKDNPYNIAFIDEGEQRA